MTFTWKGCTLILLADLHFVTRFCDATFDSLFLSRVRKLRLLWCVYTAWHIDRHRDREIPINLRGTRCRVCVVWTPPKYSIKLNFLSVFIGLGSGRVNTHFSKVPFLNKRVPSHSMRANFIANWASPKPRYVLQCRPLSLSVNKP